MCQRCRFTSCDDTKFASCNVRMSEPAGDSGGEHSCLRKV